MKNVKLIMLNLALAGALILGISNAAPAEGIADAEPQNSANPTVTANKYSPQAVSTDNTNYEANSGLKSGDRDGCGDCAGCAYNCPAAGNVN